MPERTPRVLVVDDDREIADMLAEHLRLTVPADTSVAYDAAGALKSDLGDPHDVILADVLLPDANALEFVRQLRDINNPKVVLITGDPTLGRAVEAMRLGVRDFIEKPFDLSQLTSVVRRLVEEQHQEQAQERRTRRLRRLSAKILSERRHLRQRLDLLCKDFVDAYRRLAERVVELQEPHD